MNKQEAKALNAEIRDAVMPLLEKYGLQLGSCNARFDDSTFNLSLKSTDPDAPLNPLDLSAVGLPKDTQTGVEFRFASTNWRFTGINMRAKKYPIQATKIADGKSYKLPYDAADAIRKVVEG